MSRFEFTTSDNQEVTGGWDPGTEKFFLTIFEDHEPALDIDSDSVGELKEIVAGLEIEPPPGFWELVEPSKFSRFSFFLRWDHKKKIWS